MASPDSSPEIEEPIYPNLFDPGCIPLNARDVSDLIKCTIREKVNYLRRKQSGEYEKKKKNVKRFKLDKTKKEKRQEKKLDYQLRKGLKKVGKKKLRPYIEDSPDDDNDNDDDDQPGDSNGDVVMRIAN
jgi:hypothetical protein